MPPATSVVVVAGLLAAGVAFACSPTVPPPAELSGSWVMATAASDGRARYDIGAVTLNDDCTYLVENMLIPEVPPVEGRWTFTAIGGLDYFTIMLDFTPHNVVMMDRTLCFLASVETWGIGFCHALWLRPAKVLEYAEKAGDQRAADAMRHLMAGRGAVADFATEGEACRSVTDAEWIENPDALRFHPKGSAIHVETTEPDGLMPLCRYATDGGALLKVQLLELNSAATPSDRFMEAAAYVIGMFASDDVAAWFENAVETRAKWPDGVAMVNHETTMQTVSVGNVAGLWEMSITRAADYALQMP